MSPVLKEVNKLDKKLTKQNAIQSLYKIDQMTKKIGGSKYRTNFEHCLWNDGLVDRKDMIDSLRSDVKEDRTSDDSYHDVDGDLCHRIDLDQPALKYVLKHPKKLYFQEAFGTDVSRGNEVKEPVDIGYVRDIFSDYEKALKHNLSIKDVRIPPSDL